jgi:phosphatidylserine/phosphatidylglycerophosphate/cardiolipin synthase-like enzyme
MPATTKAFALALTGLFFGVLAACSGMLPNTVIPRHLAVRYVGALDAATPIPTVIHDRGINVPDPTSNVPLLEQLEAELARSDVHQSFAGVTYDLTSGNRLASDWIVQSPNRWGRRASDLPFYPLDCTNCEPDVRLPTCTADADCPGGGTCNEIWPRPGSPRNARRKVCFGHSDGLIVRLHDLIASARQRIDINLLEPPPGTRFLGTIRDALDSLARTHRAISVRILIGQYPTGEVDVPAFLKALTAGLADISGSRLSVSVSAMRSCVAFEDCDSYSWNHSKIVAVDGREALVGGHNLWSDDYLIDNPVHDLSMQVSGPAATSAAHFADALWQFVCANLDKKAAISVASLPAGATVPIGECLPPQPLLHQSKGTRGGISILGVGRLAAGITKDFANQSELARDLMLGTARHDIRIVQQDLGFNLARADTLFPDSTFDRFVDFLRREQGDIYIVLSDLGATGDSGSSYSNNVTLAQIALHLRDAVQRRIYARDPLARYEIRRGPDPVNEMLCSRVHLAPFRFGPDAAWPGGHPIANHAKFWMVDDRTFYIGSDNMYPVNLQEYGYIVDDAKAAADITKAYWKPLWEWSSRAAVSGPGIEPCIFRTVPNR